MRYKWLRFYNVTQRIESWFNNKWSWSVSLNWTRSHYMGKQKMKTTYCKICSLHGAQECTQT